MPTLCLDVGSTWTKGLLVGDDGAVLAAATHETTVERDVLAGVDAVGRMVTAETGVLLGDDDLLVASSAGGGLRLAVVGQEMEVTAEAGRRVGLSAGAVVVHVAAGSLTPAGIGDLRASRPDLVLLCGGTDGGNADVIRRNAAALSRARVAAPIVVAGNSDATADVVAVLERTGRRYLVTDNVLPAIGQIAPAPARTAIREAFLRHVIGGKGLSRGPRFASLVRAATPDAVLAGAGVLAGTLGADVLVVDIGGATTDVHSVLTPRGEDADLRREVVAPLWQARTVEADLGMRWTAERVLEAAERERWSVAAPSADWARHVAADPTRLPADAGESAAEEDLARAAVTIAVRRHGRAHAPGDDPRPLREVGLVVGGGGVLRHAPRLADAVLAGVLDDHGGGWRVPTGARRVVDVDSRLAAVGLLQQYRPQVARALARGLLP